MTLGPLKHSPVDVINSELLAPLWDFFSGESVDFFFKANGGIMLIN